MCFRILIALRCFLESDLRDLENTQELELAVLNGYDGHYHQTDHNKPFEVLLQF